MNIRNTINIYLEYILIYRVKYVILIYFYMNTNTIPTKKIHFLFIPFLIILFFQPWPDEARLGLISLWISDILKNILIIILLCILLATKSGSKISYNLVFILIFYQFSIFLSFALNTYFVQSNDYYELIRPTFILLTCFFLINIDNIKMEETYYKFIIFFGLIQVVVIVGQYMLIDFFVNKLSLFYENAKSYELDFRATGTLANPNILGFYLINCIIVSITYLKKIWQKIFFVTLFIVAVLSTSSLLLTPLSIVFLFLFLIIKNKKSINYFKLFVYGLFIVGILIIIILLSLNLIIHFFPRFERLMDIANLLEMKNLQLRFHHWQNLYTIFERTGVRAWLFGLSPRKHFGFGWVDNDYLFILFRYGILGIISFFVLICKFLNDLRRNISHTIAKIAFINILLFFACALFYESFSTWRLMYLFLIPYGITMNKTRHSYVSIPDAVLSPI